jgi:transcriptional regulator of arginine metabolism
MVTRSSPPLPARLPGAYNLGSMPERERRHAAILELIRAERIGSQEELRELLAERGFDVTQATLSHDLRGLGVVKAPGASGSTRYTVPADAEQAVPALRRLLPVLYISSEGTGQLLVVRTRTGAAQPVAEAIDREEWDEVLGTIAGDNTVLLILRDARKLRTVQRRLEELAEG